MKRFYALFWIFIAFALCTHSPQAKSAPEVTTMQKLILDLFDSVERNRDCRPLLVVLV